MWIAEPSDRCRAVAVAALLLLLLGLGACGGPRVDQVRFYNRPIVRAVNDRRNVTEKPDEYVHLRLRYQLDQYTYKQLLRIFSAHEYLRAQNTNALDEVPDSAWFTNRLGVREVSPAEI